MVLLDFYMFSWVNVWNYWVIPRERSAEPLPLLNHSQFKSTQLFQGFPPTQGSKNKPPCRGPKKQNLLAVVQRNNNPRAVFSFYALFRFTLFQVFFPLTVQRNNLLTVAQRTKLPYAAFSSCTLSKKNNKLLFFLSKESSLPASSLSLLPLRHALMLRCRCYALCFCVGFCDSA